MKSEKKPRRVSRRTALKVGASAVVPAIAAACGDTTGAGGAGGAGGSGAGGGSGSDTASIDHIVVLMMENRSYDHFLGSRAFDGLPGDGLEMTMSNQDSAGVDQPVYRESILCVADPPHGWDPSHAQFDDGKNDGFLKAYEAAQGAGVDPHVMGYFTKEDLPVTHALADAYTSCDRWFASVMGPTWPNRFYLHAAQSGGLKSNDSPQEKLTTIYDRLDEAKIDWQYYYTDLPFIVTLGLSKFTAAAPNFFDAAKNGTLPAVSVVDPGFALNDDHPPHHPLLGQQFIASIYQALATSPLWNKCLLIVIYDEHGGFFDHVPPPKTEDDRASEGFDQLGFRIPAIIAGPWVKKGYVSSVVYDHTSVLKHIEKRFGLQPLTARDAAANDLSDVIDQDRMTNNQPEAPITLPAVDIDASMIDPMCKTMVPQSHQTGKPARDDGSQKTDLELFADAGNIPKQYDLRHKRRETAFFIGDYLESHGIGSIKR